LLVYYLTCGKDDSDDCIDIAYPASDCWSTCLLFFFYCPSAFFIVLISSGRQLNSMIAAIETASVPEPLMLALLSLAFYRPDVLWIQEETVIFPMKSRRDQAYIMPA
jgi:hypothetical protein